jgi:hypothetical protein
MRERARVRGEMLDYAALLPLIRPSATFSFMPQRVLREKGLAAN